MADITIPGAGGAETISGTGDPSIDVQIQNSFQNAPSDVRIGMPVTDPGTPVTVVINGPAPPTVTLSQNVRDVIIAGGGTTTVDAGDLGDVNIALIDAPDSQVDIRSGSATVIAGDGNTTVNAGWNGGSTSILSGAGTDSVGAYSGGATISTGDGDDNIMLNGGSTVNAGAGNDSLWVDEVGRGGSTTYNIETGAGDDLVILKDGAATISNSAGFDTIFADTAALSVTSGTGGTNVAIQAGTLTFIGGAGSDLVTGGAGSITVTGGSGTGWFVGGSAGGNSIVAAGGASALIAGGTNDTLVAAGAGNDQLYASTGNVTLLGGTSTGDNLFTGLGVGGVAGDAVLNIQAGVGNDLLVFARGNATAAGGGGVDVFRFADAYTAGNTVTITDFAVGTDKLQLAGYTGAGTDVDGVVSNTTDSGGTTLTLSDGTRIVMTNVTTAGDVNRFL